MSAAEKMPPALDVGAEMRTIEELIELLAASTDPSARDVAQELVQRLLAVHKHALTVLVDAAEAGLGRALEDDLVAGVLALHHLDPAAALPLEDEDEDEPDDEPAPLAVAEAAALAPDEPPLMAGSLDVKDGVDTSLPQPALRALCDGCGQALEDRHQHLFHGAELRCVCARCGAHAQAPWRKVRQRCVELDPSVSDWFDVRGEIGFIVVDRVSGAARATCPSPAGLVATDISADAWRSACARMPPLADLEPDAEALLVSKLGGERCAFLVGVDVCFHLGALLRDGWRSAAGAEQAVARVVQELERMRAAQLVAEGAWR